MKHCTQCGEPLEGDARFCARCGAPIVNADGDPMIGKVVVDRYLLVEKIGQGGSGTIYRAQHTTLRRKVAVKILHHQLSQDETAIERFRREATTVGEIDNEHILQVLDFGRAEDQRLFFAMEYLEGETLTKVLEREGALAIARVVDVLSQVAEALMDAHGLGYIHRDLRPRNVYLTTKKGRADFVKLLDFGLAKLIVPSRLGEARHTALGMTFGDPRYMSPEQARGETVDRRADIYSLGVIAFEMLTGKPPYTGGGTFQILQKHLDDPVPEVRALRPDCPPWLDATVRKMLAKKPDERFVTVLKVLECLRGQKAPPTPDQEERQQHERLTATAQIKAAVPEPQAYPPVPAPVAAPPPAAAPPRAAAPPPAATPLAAALPPPAAPPFGSGSVGAPPLAASPPAAQPFGSGSVGAPPPAASPPGAPPFGSGSVGAPPLAASPGAPPFGSGSVGAPPFGSAPVGAPPLAASPPAGAPPPAAALASSPANPERRDRVAGSESQDSASAGAPAAHVAAPPAPVPWVPPPASSQPPPASSQPPPVPQVVSPAATQQMVALTPPSVMEARAGEVRGAHRSGPAMENVPSVVVEGHSKEKTVPVRPPPGEPPRPSPATARAQSKETREKDPTGEWFSESGKFVPTAQTAGQYEDDYEEPQRHRSGLILGGVAGGLTLVGGLVILLLPKPAHTPVRGETPEEPAASAQPSTSPGAAPAASPSAPPATATAPSPSGDSPTGATAAPTTPSAAAPTPPSAATPTPPSAAAPTAAPPSPASVAAAPGERAAAERAAAERVNAERTAAEKAAVEKANAEKAAAAERAAAAQKPAAATVAPGKPALSAPASKPEPAVAVVASKSATPGKAEKPEKAEKHSSHSRLADPFGKDPFAEPTKATSESAQAEFFLKLGRQKLNASDLTGAANNFNKAREYDSRSPDAFAGLGEVAFEQGDYNTAKINLMQALRLSPSKPRYLVLLGQTYYKLGRARDAVNEYKKALRLDPGNAEAQHSLEVAERKLAQQGG